VIDLGLVQKVGHQHAAEAVDGVDRRAVGPVHGRQRVIGAEQVARAVDQVEVADRLVVTIAVLWPRLRPVLSFLPCSSPNNTMGTVGEGGTVGKRPSRAPPAISAISATGF